MAESRRRKLAARAALAFSVAHGADGAVALTLFSGRRLLSRDLSGVDVQALVLLLTQTSLLLPDPQSKTVCELSLRRPFSISGSDTHA